MSKDATDSRPWVVLVGGFLGAGKTTLILEAARVLQTRGVRCAAILNDQSERLVDTLQAELRGVNALEVTGGCLCCRFSDLEKAITDLREYAPDVIFAEPVGSCTDLVATVLNPLLEEFELCRIAPFTVLVDPARAVALQREDADMDMVFLWQQQLSEADIICTSKADLYPDTFSIAGRAIHHLSARTGHGLSEWLDQILSPSGTSARQTLDIDYERYAQAEAALAWLNLSMKLDLDVAASPAMVAGPLLDRLNNALTIEGIAIVHLKLIARSSEGWIKAALCANSEVPTVEGCLDASSSKHHELLLNLRAVAEPEDVQRVVEQEIERLEGEVSDLRLNCFSPAPPRPERRIAKIAH